MSSPACIVSEREPHVDRIHTKPDGFVIVLVGLSVSKTILSTSVAYSSSWNYNWTWCRTDSDTQGELFSLSQPIQSATVDPAAAVKTY